MNATPDMPGTGDLPALRDAAKTLLCLIPALAFYLLAGDSGLSPQGRGVLATLIFMTLVWVSEAVSFAVSAFYLIVAMTLFTAYATPDPGTAQSAAQNGAIGTKAALALALKGFSSGAWFLVVAALCLSGAIQQTGLGKRVALLVLARAGSRPRRIRGGILGLCFVLTMFIPAQAANAVLMTAVGVSLLDVLGMKRNSNFAKGLMLCVAFGCPLAGMGVLTSGAPPIQTADLIAQATGRTLSWLAWLLYGMPLALFVGAILFALLEWRFPVKAEEVAGSGGAVREAMKQLGAASPKEKKLLAVMCGTISLWATGGSLHSLDNTTVALLAVALTLTPGIAVITWKELRAIISWETLLLFGGAISLGQALLSTGAAAWVARETIARAGLGSCPAPVIVGVTVFFFALFSLAFSSRAAAVAALVPTAIGFAQALPETSGLSVWGLALISYYGVQFSVILPVHTPMSMVAYSSATFSAREMAGIGVPLCLAAVLSVVLFSETYWRWVGVL